MRFYEINESPMYVIGDVSIYDTLLKKKKLVKVGKDFEPGYPGGSVYLKKSDAIKAALNATRTHRGKYAVYKLEKSYHPDYLWSPKKGSNNLLIKMNVASKITE